MVRRRRDLAPEEVALWDEVKKTAEPLVAPKPVRKRRVRRVVEPPSPVVAAPPPQTASPPPAAAAPAPVRKRFRVGELAPIIPGPPPTAPVPVVRRAPAPSALMELDRRTRARLARGRIAIDGRIDLHGFTQDAAHERLFAYIAGVQADGGRVVLVITGKGVEDGATDRGVLRRAVPHWLSSPRFRPFVAGYDEANRRHGGAGAIYVRLRRRR